MSTHGAKVKAVKLHEEFIVRADEIAKVDLENLEVLKSLKNGITNKETPFNQSSRETSQWHKKGTENLDVNNFRERQKLFDTVTELERSSAAKWDDIQETINLSMKKKKRENELNQKRFDELREHFDTLFYRAMGFTTNADPDRWLQLFQS